MRKALRLDSLKIAFLNCFFKRGSCQRLIEWIEVVTSLGADKIFFYETNIHEGIKKVIHSKLKVKVKG